MSTWERKAHSIAAGYSLESARKVRTKRDLAKGRWKPYRPPEIVDALVKGLGLHDAQERERELKRLFEVERQGCWTLI